MRHNDLTIMVKTGILYTHNLTTVVQPGYPRDALNAHTSLLTGPFLMTADRLRMVGGPLNGQALWLDGEKASVRVSIASTADTPKRTYEYRREGPGLLFVGEVEAADVIVAPKTSGKNRVPTSPKGPPKS